MMIWSDFFGECINSGFTVAGKHYSWNEENLIYLCDEAEEDEYGNLDCLQGIPISAVVDK